MGKVLRPFSRSPVADVMHLHIPQKIKSQVIFFSSKNLKYAIFKPDPVGLFTKVSFFFLWWLNIVFISILSEPC